MAADFHTHILPGIDDGSQSVAESLQMLEALRQQGVSRIVATPHFYASNDHPHRFLERREKALEALTGAMPEDVPKIYPGAEVHYFEGISDCEALEEMAIGDTGLVMIEMPPAPWRSRMLQELQGIHQKRGLTPVIAHIDRYISPFRNCGILRDLRQLPVLVQANAGFFLRRTTRAMALRMLAAGDIDLLGSDCHNLTTRKPNLGDALVVIRRKLGEGALEALSEKEERFL